MLLQYLLTGRSGKVKSLVRSYTNFLRLLVPYVTTQKVEMFVGVGFWIRIEYS